MKSFGFTKMEELSKVPTVVGFLLFQKGVFWINLLKG